MASLRGRGWWWWGVGTRGFAFFGRHKPEYFSADTGTPETYIFRQNCWLRHRFSRRLLYQIAGMLSTMGSSAQLPTVTRHNTVHMAATVDSMYCTPKLALSTRPAFYFPSCQRLATLFTLNHIGTCCEQIVGKRKRFTSASVRVAQTWVVDGGRCSRSEG